MNATSPPQNPDPTQKSLWRPLRLMQQAMDDDIARLYRERGVEIRPRFVMPLIRLSQRGPMTVRELAESLNVTHSAMSQTVTALRKDGLVRTRTGTDARTRQVTLTQRSQELVPFFEAEWRATEQALAQLEAEIPYALSQVVTDIEAALARRSFRDRIAANLETAEETS